MEYCSRQCIHRTLYAVMIGISPIVICLLLIGLARLILHSLEIVYYRRHKTTDQQNHRLRRRSSSVSHQTGRLTLSYTPVSIVELQRIIRGEYHSDSSSTPNENTSPKFMKSILTRHEPLTPTNTLANLVIRRNAINSTPFTALFAPASTSITPTIDTINEQLPSKSNLMTITHESVATTTTLAGSNNDHYFDIEQTDNDLVFNSPQTTTTTTTTTVVIEEFLDCHSIPYSLNLANSMLEEDF